MERAVQQSTNRVMNDIYNGEIQSDYTLNAWDDTTESDVIYYGYSKPGTMDNSEEWLVQRVDNANKRITRAKGSWTNRTTLSFL